MMIWLLTLGCIAAYIGGLFLLVRVTPGLLTRAFDEALFIGVAAAAIFGAMLIFGAIGVIEAVANGALLARILGALLLIVQGVITLRIGLSTLRQPYDATVRTYRASRIMTGIFFFALTAASLGVLLLLFQAK
jgi:hypothetical protein